MRQCIKILHDDEVFYFDDVNNDLDTLLENVSRDCVKKHKTDYYNIPCAFDIETSNFTYKGEKCACMYIWMFSIDDNIIIGRTWGEFKILCDYLVKHLSLSVKYRHLIVYVHNLPFEFQFICERFVWHRVFALDNRVPLTALTDSGIEFRCSYKLSGYKLSKVGEMLQKYQVNKMVGDLDYKLIRHFKTPLTSTEMGYCINDVRVLSNYIREKIENEGKITNIPLTKTGYVRLYCRQHIYGKNHSDSKQYKYYRSLMNDLTIEPTEFKLMLQAFQGGFTHANPFYSGVTLENIVSFDFNSDYPTQLIAEKRYPMGKGELYTPKNKKDFQEQLNKYCCIFIIKFTGLESKILYDNYISCSKCRNISNVTLNNGRVVSADSLEITITDIDYDIISECYSWQKQEISMFYRYKRGYLPTDFIKCVLDFYEIKTTLKNVVGKEIEYLQGKENLNSTYGMCVTNPAKPIITFLNDLEETKSAGWVTHDLNLSEEIEKYNKKKNRFIYYPWGIFCTSLAREKLWKYGILKIKHDYVYSDTDSIKFINPEENLHVIEEYNKMISKKLIAAMKYHNIPLERLTPKTIEGIPRPLGLWEQDGDYSKFKTLGAKRYIYTDKKDDSLHVTVAGLNKKAGVNYLQKFENPYEVFNDGMEVPESESDKLTATYIDYETSGTITDYLGNKGEFHEYTSLNLSPSPYEMKIAADYSNYLLNIGEINL